MNRIFSGIVITFFTLNCFSQHIENVHFEQKGTKIFIYYNIANSNPRSLYNIDIFVSDNNGKKWIGPLSKVTGAVGKNQNASDNKKIIWDVLSEQETIVGNISFRIKAGIIENAGYLVDNRDEKIYEWILIGSQIWMAENLNYKTNYGSFCYNENRNNCDVYGRLYRWHSAKKSCPTGWHLPGKTEWEELINNLGGNEIALDEMIEKTYTPSYYSNQLNNASGFSAVPGGYLSIGSYYNLGKQAYFWTNTENKNNNLQAWNIYINFKKMVIKLRSDNKNYGRSVRCVKDSIDLQ